MQKSKFLFALSAIALIFSACTEKTPGSSEEEDPTPGPGPEDIVAPENVRTMQSVTGCSLDSDCQTGAFCFQNLCVKQCDSDGLSCESGYYCQQSRGRCVTQEYLTEYKKVQDQMTAAGDKLTSEDRARYIADLDYKAARASNVVRSVLGQKNEEGGTVNGVNLVRSLPSGALLDSKKDSLSLSMESKEALGTVHYVVNMGDGEIPVLKTAKSKKQADGTYAYSFDVDSKKIIEKRRKHHRDGGDEISTDMESIEVVSSAGVFPVTLLDAPPASGLYKGNVVPDAILSGIDLPIRMGVKTTPEKPSSFSDITAITFYLPSSGNDVFSPENVEAGKETWASITVTQKDLASNCSSGKPCFAATFSTNDYAPAKSVVISKDSKVNRSIRVEFFEFDPETLTFYGRIEDRLRGLYRESTVKDGTVARTYNDTKMDGGLTVTFDNVFDETKVTAKEHTPATEAIRDVTEAPAAVCKTSTIKTLVGKLDDTYGKKCTGAIADDEELKAACDMYRECSAVTTLDAFNKLDPTVQNFCVNGAAESILSDDTRLSAVLSAVLTADASKPSTEGPVATACGIEINNFKDFVTACTTEGCDLCNERPELECEADLLAREYLNSDELPSEAKTAIMNNWLNVVRESYLAQEYMAWSADTDIRKSWLTGAVYTNTFASSMMDDFNEGLLKDYRVKVLDAHHDVMRKQATQSVLEMLSQTMNDAGDGISELSSTRNAVLGELAQTWESLARDLGLATKRYDVLSQNDSDRIKQAAELRPYLFDLYFAGLIDSAINLKADQGSLNASFGSNLVSIIGKLESLDQGFEDLVFMRDGEIVTDTRLGESHTESMLDSLKSDAEKSVAAAVQKRKDVFKEMDDKAMNQAQLEDSYKTALEQLRAELVNLCGYPADCNSPEKRAKCKIHTAPYFCGFSIESTDGGEIDIAAKTVTDKDGKEVSADQARIGQIIDYMECAKKTGTDKCGGNLNLEADQVSYDGGTTYSQAALAIMEYREAAQDYETARAEYDIMAQKIRNNYATLDAYAKNIESWYSKRKETLAAISTNLEQIKNYEGGILAIESEIDKAETDAAAKEFEEESKNLKNWTALAATNMGVQDAAQVILTGNTIAGIWVDDAVQDQDRAAFLAELRSIASNTASTAAPVNPGAAGTTAASTAASTASQTAASLAQKAQKGLAVGSASAELAANLAQNSFDFTIERLDREKDHNIAKIQQDLAKTLSDIKVKVKDLSTGEDVEMDNITELNQLIADLDRANEKLLQDMASEEQYKRDLQELDLLRNEFKNDALDLITQNHVVQVKNVAKARALVKYFTIVQEALLVQDQFDAKYRRYMDVSNIVFSASKFFQNASDLEQVEEFVEYARNDLSDYLTAIEYEAVRPFVDLRRAIYTARGTNEFESILAQLNDLTKNCGSGTPSENTVNISMRSRLGIADAAFDGMSSADRFHQVLKNGNLHVNAQTRYTVDGSIADKLKKGEYYSGSFSLTSSFANIGTSCDARIQSIEVRFVSKEGTKIRETGDAAPSITLFYGGQSTLMSCHNKIEAITKSIGPRTTYGKYSTFMATPFGNGLNASIYNVEEGSNYALSTNTKFDGTTIYKGLKGYPLMATYSILFDPNANENSGINWDNVADIELQIKYTTGSLGQNDAKCKYDIEG